MCKQGATLTGQNNTKQYSFLHLYFSNYTFTLTLNCTEIQMKILFPLNEPSVSAN